MAALGKISKSSLFFVTWSADPQRQAVDQQGRTWMSSVFTDYDSARYDTKMRTVASHLKHFGVNKEVARRVHQFYEFRFQNKLMFQDDDILEELPIKLKSTIVLQRFQKTGIHRHAPLLLLPASGSIHYVSLT